MSIADPLTCGFVKVIGYEIFKQNYGIRKLEHENKNQFQGRIQKRQYIEFQKIFSSDINDKFDIPYTKFTCNFPKMIKIFQGMNKKNQSKLAMVLKTFSRENWDNLSNDEKMKHSIVDCDGCIKKKVFRDQLANIPIHSRQLHAKATKAGLFRERILADITNKIVENLDAQYQQEYRTTFSTQAKKHVPELQPERLDKVKLAKSIVTDCENQYRETDLDR